MYMYCFFLWNLTLIYFERREKRKNLNRKKGKKEIEGKWEKRENGKRGKRSFRTRYLYAHTARLYLFFIFKKFLGGPYREAPLIKK
jgi:hypothetical protein